MKRKNQNPREYSLRHCKERARERYGFDLTDNEYDSLTNQLKTDMLLRCFPKDTPKLKLVNQEGAQVTLIVPFRDMQLVCVFDMSSGLMKTLLPPEQFSEHLG